MKSKHGVWPLAYDLDLKPQPILGQGRPPYQNQGQRSNLSARRAHTDGHYQVPYLPASVSIINDGTGMSLHIIHEVPYPFTVIHMHLYRNLSWKCFNTSE